MVLASVTITLLTSQTATFTYPEQRDPPDLVYPTKDTPIAVQGTPTRTQTVFVNNGLADTVTFILFFWDASELTTEDNFVPLTWQGQ
jgi:hypothetical protein